MGLIRLIDSMKTDNLVDLCDKLQDYKDFMVAKYHRVGKPERAESVRDRVDTIMICVDALAEGSIKTVKTLKESINNLFSNMRGGICLSTIHKAKGLEWDTVYFLDRDLIPSKYAIQEWQLTQEDNLMYVGITRAHESLYFVHSRDVGE